MALETVAKVQNTSLIQELDHIADADLNALIGRAGYILSLRDRQRKDAAVQKAEELLRDAGVDYMEITKTKRRKRAKKAKA